MLLMPVALMWVFGQMGGRGSGPPKIALAVVDHDGGWLARALVEDIASERIELERIELPGETGAGAARAGAGGGEPRARALVVPEGVTSKVLAGHPPVL